MPECVDASGGAKIKDELAKYNVQPVTDGTGSYCFAGGIQQIADPNVIPITILKAVFCTQIYMGASNMVFEDLFGINAHLSPTFVQPEAIR
jgi:hypothetical protein